MERSNAQVDGHAGAQTEKVLSQSSNDQGGRHSEDQNAMLLVMVEFAVSEAHDTRNSVKEEPRATSGCGGVGANGGGGGAGPNQRRRRIAEAISGGGGGRTRSDDGVGDTWGREWAITGPRSFVDGRRADPKKGAAAAVRKKGQRRRFEKRGSDGGEQQRRRRRPRSDSDAGGEYRAAAAAPANKLDRARARDDSRSTGVADERMSRRVAVDVDDGTGRRRRRRRRWWRRIFGDGATAGIFGVSDEMGLQGRG
ncbi:hypothetical protein Scep_014536 [Stephania cephalantha]|uniref:Uncharacterized protein n=1 Tax=Stephania cephalantha TaxID=152367 RepID=A0AAP0J267_9MAGN